MVLFLQYIRERGIVMSINGRKGCALYTHILAVHHYRDLPASPSSSCCSSSCSSSLFFVLRNSSSSL